MNCRGSQSVRKISCGRGKSDNFTFILHRHLLFDWVPERVINTAKIPKKLYSVDLCDLCHPVGDLSSPMGNVANQPHRGLSPYLVGGLRSHG